MMPPLLRPAACTDLSEIYAFELDYIRRIEPEQEARWIEAVPRQLRQWTDSLPRMVVAELEGRLRGHACWEQDAAAAGANAAVLSSIYVAVGWRRRGVGQELLSWCERDAAASGAVWMRLSVKPDNPARCLYERAGYLLQRREGGYDHYEKRLG